MALSRVNVVLAEARAKARPCVALSYGPAAAARFGGAPDLASDIAWPDRDGRPLAFLAQLDCAALGAAGSPDWFPERGMLFVFYDLIEQPWGFDPDDCSGWAVIYDERGPAQARREVPDGVVDEPDLQPIETGLIGRPALSIPAGRLDIETDDAEVAEAIDNALDAAMREPFTNGIRHQVGGYPHPIQRDDMEWNASSPATGSAAEAARPTAVPEAKP